MFSNSKTNQITFLKITLLSFLMLILTGCESKTVSKEVLDGPSAGEVKVWILNSFSQPIEKIKQAFQKTNDGKNIKFKITEFSSLNDIEQALPKALAEGWNPDLVMVSGDYIYNNFRQFNYAVNDEGFSPDLFRQVFVRTIGESLIIDKKIYGVPLAVDTLALLYNSKHLSTRLKNRNIPSNNWKELQQDIRNLTIKNSLQNTNIARSGLAFGDSDNIFYSSEIIENMLAQFPNSIFSNDGKSIKLNNNKQDFFGTKKLITSAILNFWKNFSQENSLNYSWSKKLITDSTNLNFNTFAQGKTSMIFAKASDLSLIKNLIKKNSSFSNTDLSASFFPQIRQNSYQDKVVLSDIYSFAVTRSSKKSIASWNFLKFLVSKKNMEKISQETLLPTPRVDLLHTQEGDRLLSIFARQAKFAKSAKYPLERTKVQNLLEQVIKKAETNQTGKNDYIKIIDRKLQQILQQKNNLNIKF